MRADVTTKGMADVDPVVSARMKQVRSRDTTPELRLRTELHRRGLRYRVDRRPVPALRRRADIVFGPARLSVMVDGCFWHGCPDHHRPSRRNSQFWSDKIAANQRRDRETDVLLTEAGWLVIRIWEHENPIAAADRVEAAVTSRRGIRCQ
ncbi:MULTISPECIES: very short patch repair endonuclease [Actinoalloteichus]|uniref:very short patch repair endonuclease n=1 Tax=Actinoalloteichus TaxID=65496 RepID=UPI00298A02D4|nr:MULTISPECIES: very short patch repair endonuclease [Actinoalloteichus]